MLSLADVQLLRTSERHLPDKRTAGCLPPVSLVRYVSPPTNDTQLGHAAKNIEAGPGCFTSLRVLAISPPLPDGCTQAELFQPETTVVVALVRGWTRGRFISVQRNVCSGMGQNIPPCIQPTGLSLRQGNFELTLFALT